MIGPQRSRRALSAVIAVGLAGSAVVSAETFVGSNVDSRVVVGFDVTDGATAGFLPEGWVPVAVPGGPLEGAEALIVLIERHVDLDAEGRPKSPAVGRAAVLAGLGRAEDEVRLYVMRIYGTSTSFDAYDNNVQAEITRETKTGGAANAGREHEDEWRVMPGAGGEMSFKLAYTTDTMGWGPGEAFPHSNVNPEFSRIYRYEQLADVVTSEPLGKPIAGEVRFESSVPELDGLFDGAEKMVGVLNIPLYARKIYLP